MKVKIRYKDIALESRFQYVIDFLNSHPLNSGLSFSTSGSADILLNYGKIDDSEASYEITRQHLLFSKASIPKEELIINHFHHEGRELYSIENKAAAPRPFLEDKLLSFDIFETIFFHISRYEEHNIKDEDKNEWGSLIESKHLLIKHQLEKIPIIDQLVCSFFELLNNKQIRKKTQLIITHDIDHVQKFNSIFDIIKKTIGFIYRRKQLKGLGKLLSDYYQFYFKRGTDPYDIFSWLLLKDELCEKIIYFLVGGKHQVDKGYNTASPVFQKAVSLAKERNYKIGIHPSYESWRDPEILQREKLHLEKLSGHSIKHSRQHYLHFDTMQTPKHLLANHIIEDSSFGYNRHIGFRCGTGFRYHMYDFNAETKSQLLQLPLVFMDSACLHESNLDGSKFISIFESFFSHNEMNTQITCNFHNSFFDEAYFRSIPMKEMYFELIKSFTNKA